MTALARNDSFANFTPTHSIKQLFKPYAISALASLRVREVTRKTPTMTEQLNNALHEAQTIVRNRHNCLGDDSSRRAQTRFSELFNDENWDEGEAMPNRQSMETLFDAIAMASVPFMSLSIAAGGALKATWMHGNLIITAVAHDDKRISWSKVVETTDSFETETNEGPISEFLSAFAS